MWHIRYPLADGSDSLIVATTRPETMLGDTAVMVHPEDERYKHLIGKKVKLPLTDREIPIIADSYVDHEFGTGCVKVTPAHDFNDYAVGQRHGLPLISILTLDAQINEHAPEKYRGLDRFDARKAVVADLEALGLLEKTDKHKLMVPRGDRTGVVIEPMLTDQWFVAMTKPGADGKSSPARRWMRRIPARSSSSRKTGSIPTTSGSTTSRTGAFRASSGGATRFRPGTATTARFSSPTTRPKPMPRPPSRATPAA